MEKYDLTSFQIDLTGLWNHPNGPQWKEGFVPILEKATPNPPAGFFNYPSPSHSHLADVDKIATELKNSFDQAICFGIGGSHLGPAALIEACGANENFPLHWVHNIDPASIERAEKFLKKGKTATLVISKSGGTSETLSAFFHFADRLDRKGWVFITDPKNGELRRLAEQLSIPSLEVPPQIGGRFSVLTPVGLLPATLSNLDPTELMKGAAALRDSLSPLPVQKNPVYLFALSQFLWDRQFQHPLHYFMPYDSRLKLFADWFVQLWAESLGKVKSSPPRESVGPTPVTALGTQDQHSILQLLKEGPANKIVGFCHVRDKGAKLQKPTTFEVSPAFSGFFQHTFGELSWKAMQATEKSLQQRPLPTYRIEIPSLTPQTLGSLFFFFEWATAIAGELYEVNAYNQPGVEEAKRYFQENLVI